MNNKIKKVGVLTLPYGPNYGWILQHYAMLNILKINGYDAYSIYRKWDYKGNRSAAYYVKRWLYYNIFTRKIYRFYKRYISPKTELYSTQESINSISKYKFDSIIVGSDQVWRTKNTIGVGNNYFLDFVESNLTKKIAYAASFGIDEWQEGEEKTLLLKNLLKDFSYISVREDTGVRICEKYFGLKVESLIDPTLLLDKEYYKQLLSNNKRKSFKNPTIITYVLDYNVEKLNIVKTISNRYHCEIFDLYPKKKKLFNYFKSVETWLSAFRDAEFVITDSFHGTVFAIIFEKPFITIANKERGLTRFTSLLNKLDLSSRLIYSFNDLVENDLIVTDINYREVKNKLDIEREKSISILCKYI